MVRRAACRDLCMLWQVTRCHVTLRSLQTTVTIGGSAGVDL